MSTAVVPIISEASETIALVFRLFDSVGGRFIFDKVVESPMMTSLFVMGADVNGG